MVHVRLLSIPLSIAIGPGSEHDSKKIVELIGGLWEKPRQLYVDSAYDTEGIRRYLESMGVEANIPVNPRNCRKPKPYNISIYKKMRSAVERLFG